MYQVKKRTWPDFRRRIAVRALRSRSCVRRDVPECCFHASRFESYGAQGFRDSVRSGIPRPASFGVRSAAVHHSFEKGSRSQHDGAAGELDPHLGFYALYAGFGRGGVEEKLRRRILPDVEVHGVFERVPPLGREARFVALGARTPHGGALRPVEHPELDGREVRDAAHLSAQSIYLSDNLTFGDSADCRVAGHRGHFGHIHRKQQRARAETRGGRGRFASGVSAADDDNIVF